MRGKRTISPAFGSRRGTPIRRRESHRGRPASKKGSDAFEISIGGGREGKGDIIPIAFQGKKREVLQYEKGESRLSRRRSYNDKYKE